MSKEDLKLLLAKFVYTNPDTELRHAIKESTIEQITDYLWPHISKAIDETRAEADAEGFKRGIMMAEVELEERRQKLKDEDFNKGIDKAVELLMKVVTIREFIQWQIDKDDTNLTWSDYFTEQLQTAKKGAK